MAYHTHEDKVFADFLVTCRQEGCGNNGVEIVIWADPNDPEVWCGGGCETRITDVVLVEEVAE